VLARLTPLERKPPDDMMWGVRTRPRGGCRNFMARFSATMTHETGHVRVALTGDCDLAVREQMSAALRDAVGRADVVVVDLADVGFLDSSGVHELVSAHHAARGRGGRLYIENPTGAVATVLDLTGVARLLSPGVDRG
jgi:anti-sigma B factor antagonist